jgi:probable F420-dependent oxidoreductase
MYGFTIPGSGPLTDPDAMAQIARRGEELGFDFLVCPDHIIFPRQVASPYPYNEEGVHPGTGPGECLDQLTMLAFLAAQTTRIRLGTSVMIVPHRNPLVAAKSIATLDVLSRGRVILGVGVGWLREEFEVLSLPPFDERGAVTDEYLRAYIELWTSDSPSFHGKYVEFNDISFLPKPVQKPHPPIWVGGESRPALRRTAELADGWYPLGSNPTFPMGTPQQLASGLERLAVYARRFGRDPSEIETIYRTHQFDLTDGAAPSTGSGQTGDRLPFVGNAEQMASDIRTYQEMGVGSLVLDFLRQTEDLDVMLGRMERFAKDVWPLV